MDFRVFNSDDWNTYSGAVSFDEKTPPLICDDLEDANIVLAADPDGIEKVMAEVFFQVPGERDVESYCAFFGSIDEAKGYLLATQDLFGINVMTFADQPKKWRRGQ